MAVTQNASAREGQAPLHGRHSVWDGPSSEHSKRNVDMKPSEELVVIRKTYDLTLWSCQHTSRFPQNHRFVLGERIERKLYDLLELLITAPDRLRSYLFRTITFCRVAAEKPCVAGRLVQQSIAERAQRQS